MNINFRHLRAFVAVAETGSLSRAAEIIHLSQPALSRLIHHLEVEGSARLFDRQSKGMTLTIYGEAFLRHARVLLWQMDEAEDALSEIRGMGRGTVRIGAVAAAVRTLLPASGSALLQNSPNIKLEVLEGSDDRLEVELLACNIDLMITGPIASKYEITNIAECRYEDCYHVICSSNHPLLSNANVTLEDVLQQNWAMSGKGSTPRNLLEVTLGQLGHGCPNISMESSSASAVLAFVSCSQLLTWMPTPLFSQYLDAGHVNILNITPLVMQRRLFVYRRSTGILPPAAVGLLKMLPLVKSSSVNQ